MVSVNPAGGSGVRESRDSWCTPKWLADIINLWEPWLDPCSNLRSHIEAAWRCTLSHFGSNGLAILAGPGVFNGALPVEGEDAWSDCTISGVAKEADRVFINPPYAHGQVLRWVRHYIHTDFVYLLRWDTSTAWFAELWPRCWGAWFPNRRVNFEPPPGVRSSSNPFPHALFLKSEPRGKFLDALLASGYLLRREGQQSVRESDRGNAEATQRTDSTGGGRAGTKQTATCQSFDRLVAEARRRAQLQDTR